MSEHDTTWAGPAVSDTTRDLPTQPPDGAASSNIPGAPAPDVDASAVPAVGQEFGPVQLLSELGRGAAGVVFLGHHKLLGRSVAVKCLMGGAGAWGEGGRRFVEEARAAAAVQHANLTQIYHADVVRDTPFLIMEYVDGPTLAGLLAHAGRMSPGLARGVMAEVAGAVGELRDRGLIHRDLKPSNVLLDRQGRVRVSDFGLAVRRATFATLATAAAEVAGTPAYMAPEMFEGRVSPRSDIYAMGVMMCQLIIGRPPFVGSFEQVVEEHRSKPLPVDTLRGAGVDDATLDLLERATHKQFLYRYKTAHEFRRALAALGVDAAESQRELARLIVSMRSGTAHGAQVTPAGTTISGEPGSSYAQTIARLATMKRERRSSSPAVPLPAPPPLTFVAAVPVDTPLPLPAPLAASAGESAVIPVARVVREPYFVPTSQRPGILTALCITGIVVATLGIAGVIVTASMVPGLKTHPADALGGPRRWAVALDAVNAVLIVLPLAGSIAAFRLKRWARRMLLAYAFAEVAWQVFNVVLGFRVLLPRFLETMQTGIKFTSPEQAQEVLLNTRNGLAMMLIARCVLGCAFAFAAIIVLRRPLVKLALGAK
ncbi:MAG TPA: serine/threonine-protein kinase [Tepidisphaeraceae bacterium]|jgi:serine/threonine protein kinase|nr:serine/threonine-protein kinase [Tepidisphaeraceae bacterium]